MAEGTVPAAQAPTTCGVRCEAPLERSSRWTPTCPPPPFSKTRVPLSVQVRVPRCRCSRGREDGAGAWPPLPPAAPRWPAAREAPLEQVGGFAPSAGGRGPGQTCPRPPSPFRSPARCWAVVGGAVLCCPRVPADGALCTSSAPCPRAERGTCRACCGRGALALCFESLPSAGLRRAPGRGCCGPGSQGGCGTVE